MQEEKASPVNECTEVEVCDMEKWSTFENNLGVSDPVADDQRGGRCRRAAN